MIRYILRNLRFSFQDLSKNILKALLSSFGILFLIAFMVMYISLRQSVKDFIGEKLLGSLDINEIVISPNPPKSKEGFSPGTVKSNTISTQKVKKIRKMKAFSGVYSVIKMTYPTWVIVSMLGKKKRLFVPVCGIDPGFFRGKVKNWKEFRNRDIVPAIAPRFTIEILNSYAAAKGWPQFSEKMLVGFPGKLKIQTTPFGAPERKQFLRHGKLHSFTSAFSFKGILVPSRFIVDFCSKHRLDTGKPVKGYSYIMMFATVRNIKELPKITKDLHKMNLRVDSQSNISKKVNRAISVIDGITLFIGALVLILTVISIFNTYLVIVHNRSFNFSLKRVIGVSKIRIILSFIIESAIIGAIYGVIGYFIGRYLIDYISGHVVDWLPVLKGLVLKPAAEGLLVKAIFFSVMISTISAFVPALFASNKNLFKTLRR